MPSSNRKQAQLIQGAVVLPNRNGTAPGQWLEVGTRKVVLLPGPPHELRPMFEESVWPRLEKERRGFLERKVLKVAGLTESRIEMLISDLYPSNPELKITVLASPGQIEIHLTSFSERSAPAARRKIGRLGEQLMSRLKENVFSESGEELEEVVGRLLRKETQTLAAAESCTGGLLSHRLTNVPGSSDYFLETAVSYSNDAKVDLLGVSPSLLEKHGAVSFPVACAMARGIRERARADYGLAITGIAGPSGGTTEKPVGLVFVALAWAGGTRVLKNLFPGGREQVKFQSAQKALDMLRRHLLNRAKKGERGKK
jgi:nicotinamide-nucleotide amidase